MNVPMSGHLKNILALLLACVVITPLLIMLSAHMQGAASGLRTRMGQKAAYAASLKQAKELGLTYESALASPAAALGKPALWCLRKSGTGRSFYKGDDTRPVYITNPERMDPTSGSSHQDCQDALIELSTFTVYSFGGPAKLRVEARFIAYP